MILLKTLKIQNVSLFKAKLSQDHSFNYNTHFVQISKLHIVIKR